MTFASFDSNRSPGPMAEININDAVGRTISGVAWSACSSVLVIAFTDGSVAALKARVPTYSRDPEIEVAQFSLGSIPADDIVRLGIATHAEVDDWDRAWRAKRKAEREAADRALYERLRAKFGG